MNPRESFHKPLAEALANFHRWDDLDTQAYLTSTPRHDLATDVYIKRRTRKPKMKPHSVHVNSLKWDLVPGFSDVYAVGAAGVPLFRFRCHDVTKARVIAACGQYGLEVRYV